MVTFRVTVNILRATEPEWFALENVDLSETDDAESNLNMIKKVLEEANYKTKTFRVIASDFGLPQRRIRIYVCGFHATKQAQASFQKVERNLAAMRLSKQNPVSCLGTSHNRI